MRYWNWRSKENHTIPTNQRIVQNQLVIFFYMLHFAMLGPHFGRYCGVATGWRSEESWCDSQLGQEISRLQSVETVSGRNRASIGYQRLFNGSEWVGAWNWPLARIIVHNTLPDCGVKIRNRFKIWNIPHATCCVTCPNKTKNVCVTTYCSLPSYVFLVWCCIEMKQA